LGPSCNCRLAQELLPGAAHEYPDARSALPLSQSNWYAEMLINRNSRRPTTCSLLDLTDPEERVTELSHLIAALPLPNYCLLRALTAHLILIVQNASVNKMTMRNVGIVFSPTLGIPAGVFSLMLGEFTRVFNVDADFVETGLNEPSGFPDDVTPRSRDKLPMVHPSKRNSLSYAEASADRLLGLSGRSLTGEFPVAAARSDDIVDDA
jgi:RalA-binding protein 1